MEQIASLEADIKRKDERIKELERKLKVALGN